MSGDSQAIGRPELITESLLRRANYLRFSGLTHESLSILESIDPDKHCPLNYGKRIIKCIYARMPQLHKASE